MNTREDNITLAHRVQHELFNAGNVDVAAEIVDEHCALYFAGQRLPEAGPDAFLRLVTELRTAFPDVRWELERQVADQDAVTLQFLVQGTHRGVFMGKAATGRSVVFHAVVILKCRNGKVIEDWAMPNLFELMMQIDAPSPAA